MRIKYLLPLGVLAIVGLWVAVLYSADTSTSCYTELGVAHYIRGGIADRQQEDFRGSIASLDCAARIDPTNWEVYYERGRTYLAGYSYSEAASEFDRALELTSDEESRFFVYINRGLMYYFQAMYEQAQDNLELAIEVNPAYGAPAYLIQGWIYAELEQYDEALSSFTSSLEADDSNDALALAERSFVYRALGQDEQANADLSRALELNPEIAAVFLTSGYSLLQANPEQAERAVRVFTQAIEIQPDFAQAYYWRAEAYSRIGDDAAQERDLLRVLVLEPGRIDSYLQLGSIYESTGRDSEALELYRNYLAQAGDNPDQRIAERLRRLEERIESGS